MNNKPTGRDQFLHDIFVTAIEVGVQSGIFGEVVYG